MSEIQYLLNAFEEASQHADPASVGYGEKRKALLARIAELERENARKDALLRECRGHLRGHKMSMLAYTTERLIAAIDAALKGQNKC